MKPDYVLIRLLSLFALDKKRNLVVIHSNDYQMTTNKKKPISLNQKKIAARKKYEKVDWKSQTKKLINFVKKKEYEVEFVSSNCYSEVDLSSKTISMHNGHRPEIEFYCLLHEIGHVLVFGTHQKYSKNLGYVYDNYRNRSLTYCVTELEEEFQAWREGYNQAKKMRLKINRLNFEKIKAQYVSTYIDWIANTKRLNKIKP